jgi:anion-transporting  ArsA/GET3 family ATPase
MSCLDSALGGKRVVICAGAGGVGKTTVSATVALGLAAQGRRVALVTIDPARRLAEALGLDALGNRPQVVDEARFGGSGLEIQGALSAMMLDAKRTFDELIGLLAPTPATRDEILRNPIYEHISTAVAGSQEYTAIAKLYELEHSADHDVIVLDTPPSRHAIDFLEAPDRLIGFLEGPAVATFLRPTGRAIHAAGFAFAALRRITGTGLLDDLTSLFRLLSELLDGFRRRAVDVRELLMDPASAFLIITSPERPALEETLFFAAELDRARMHRAGVIVNRVHPLGADGPEIRGTAARLAPMLGASLAERTARTHAEVQRLAQRDAAAIARLRSALQDEPVSLADRPSDVHDIPGLVALCEELFECQDAQGTHRRIPPAGSADGEDPRLRHG